MCCILYNFCLKHLILRRIQQGIIRNVHMSSCKVPVIFVKLNYLDRFSKNLQVTNFMRICPVVAALFHVDKWMDRRTHMIKLIIAFHNFTNVPKKDKSRKIIAAKNGFHQESEGRLITAECGMHENRNTKEEMLI